MEEDDSYDSWDGLPTSVYQPLLVEKQLVSSRSLATFLFLSLSFHTHNALNHTHGCVLCGPHRTPSVCQPTSYHLLHLLTHSLPFVIAVQEALGRLMDPALAYHPVCTGNCFKKVPTALSSLPPSFFYPLQTMCIPSRWLLSACFLPPSHSAPSTLPFLSTAQRSLLAVFPIPRTVGSFLAKPATLHITSRSLCFWQVGFCWCDDTCVKRGDCCPGFVFEVLTDHNYVCFEYRPSFFHLATRHSYSLSDP